MQQKNKIWIGFLLSSMVVFFVLSQGLSGGYLLDDFVNLQPLREIVAPLTWSQAIDFAILQSEHSHSGRPLSYLSFALQYHSWPNSPGAFRLFNIAIHILNGFCIFIIARQIRCLVYPGRESLDWFAVWSAAFWMLHPINVSSVLYVVQRMASLSASFMLIGTWLFVWARACLCSKDSLRGYCIATFAVVFMGFGAFFSKENGILLPVLLLIVDCVLFQELPLPKHWKLWRRIFLITPTFAIFLFLILQCWQGPSLLREFSVQERLLTQPRVLFTYLYKIFLPRPSAFGLYFDDYQWSTRLLEPVTTVISILALCFSLAIAVACHNRNRWLAFAIYWFFAAHLLESSSVMLELYFEHRNYVPLVGIAIGLPFMFLSKEGRLPRSVAMRFSSLLVLLFFAILTYSEARLWGNEIRQQLTWGKEHPNSVRAQVAMGIAKLKAGNAKDALDGLMLASRRIPNSNAMIATAMTLACDADYVELVDINLIEDRFRNSVFSFGAPSALNQIVEAKEQGGCKRLSNEYVAHAINSLLDNVKYHVPKYNSHLLFLLARIHALDRQLGLAIGYAEMAREMYPRVDVLLQEVYWLISAGEFADAGDKIKLVDDCLQKDALKRKLFMPRLDELKKMMESNVQESPIKAKQ